MFLKENKDSTIKGRIVEGGKKRDFMVNEDHYKYSRKIKTVQSKVESWQEGKKGLHG